MAYGPVNVPGSAGAELETVRTLASTALDTANTANSAASKAQATADAALEAANNAQSSASAAQSTADSAASQAATNASDIATIKGTADTALETANEAKQLATEANTAAANAQAAASDALSLITTINSTIGSLPTQNGTLTYTGSELSPTWNNYDSDKLTIGGTTSGTDVGTYTATFTPTGDYVWSDGTQDTVEVTWSISRATISLPSQSGTLTYTGSAQSPTWSNYDSTKMTIGGTTSGTNAGSYTATFTPGDNYQWSDGTTTAKSVTWSIGKAAGSLSLSSTSMTLNSSTTSATSTVTRSGDGTISASSSATSVATVSVSGTTVTVTGVGAGSATITVSVAEGTNYLAPSSKTISVTVTMPSATLNSNEWSTISEASSAGTAANYWSVGDTKSVALSGTIGTLSISKTEYVYILGFNHNSSVEGSGISFGCFKTAQSSGTDVCLVDSHYGSYSNDGSLRFNMNHWGDSSTYNYNYGGWKGCDLRYDILGSTNTAPSGYGSVATTSRTGYDASTTCATSPVSGTLMSCLPSALRAVMKPITKYTDNTGNASNSSGNVTTSVDYLPLLSEYEVQGVRSYANTYEQNHQKQYNYYSAGNSKIKYRHSSTGSTAYWWCRSPRYSGASHFCFVGTDGGANYTSSEYSRGLAPAFLI